VLDAGYDAPRIAHLLPRRRVHLRRPRNLGHRARRDGHGHPALWEGDRAGVGPTAPAADPPGRMARRCPSSRAPSSGWSFRSCPAAGSPSRSGCRGRAPAPPKRTSTAAGSPSSAASTSSTHSAWLRSPEAAARWTWLVIAAYAQLRLARPLATDLRRPWEKPTEPNRLTPARVRRGFRNLRTKTGSPAGAPKPTRPGPGRPRLEEPPPRQPLRRGSRPRHRRALHPTRTPQGRHEAPTRWRIDKLRLIGGHHRSGTPVPRGTPGAGWHSALPCTAWVEPRRPRSQERRRRGRGTGP
jgi:hypothetical protein